MQSGFEKENALSKNYNRPEHSEYTYDDVNEE